MLETLLKADNEEVEEYVSTHPTNLETLERSTNAQLMNKAVEVATSFLLLPLSFSSVYVRVAVAVAATKQVCVVLCVLCKYRSCD